MLSYLKRFIGISEVVPSSRCYMSFIQYRYDIWVEHKNLNFVICVLKIETKFKEKLKRSQFERDQDFVKFTSYMKFFFSLKLSSF